MCCAHCENEFEFDLEDDIIVSPGGALRATLMDMGDFLMDVLQEIEAGELKISVSHNYETGDVEFKAKVDSRKVLEIKANDFVPYLAD